MSMLPRDIRGIREPAVNGKSQPVEIVGVDSDRLEKDDTFPDAYAFYVTLTGRPDFVWQSHLAKWDSALDRQHRKISVENNRLRLVFAYGDNMQLFADYAASLVDWVNERVAEHNSTIASLEDEQLRKQQVDQTKQQYMLEELKRVSSRPSGSSQDMTVRKLTAMFEKDSAAYERCRNTILKIRGFVNGIERNYIVLADEYRSGKTLLCVFDKGRDQQLKRLRTGQMVTVTGEFEGSVLQLSMRHCSLIQ
jgi:hypothetical protein